MTRYVEKSRIVGAMRWTGDNTRDVMLWINPNLAPHAMADGFWMRQRDGRMNLMVPLDLGLSTRSERAAQPGDWIVRERAGDCFVVPAADFPARFIEVPA